MCTNEAEKGVVSTMPFLSFQLIKIQNVHVCYTRNDAIFVNQGRKKSKAVGFNILPK